MMKKFILLPLFVFIISQNIIGAPKEEVEETNVGSIPRYVFFIEPRTLNDKRSINEAIHELQMTKEIVQAYYDDLKAQEQKSELETDLETKMSERRAGIADE